MGMLAYSFSMLSGGGIQAPNGNPSLFTLTAKSDTELDFSFTIGSTNQDGHYIYLSLTEVGGYSLVKTVTGATNSGTIDSLTENTTYYGYVVAFKGSKESNASNTSNAITNYQILTEASIISISLFNSNRNGIVCDGILIPESSVDINYRNYLAFKLLTKTA